MWFCTISTFAVVKVHKVYFDRKPFTTFLFSYCSSVQSSVYTLVGLNMSLKAATNLHPVPQSALLCPSVPTLKNNPGNTFFSALFLFPLFFFHDDKLHTCQFPTDSHILCTLARVPVWLMKSGPESVCWVYFFTLRLKIPLEEVTACV